MADTSLFFDWLVVLSIGLMSITVPTYAISVSIMGRERKRAILDRERRVEELEKKVHDLSTRLGTDPGVVALQGEIASYKKTSRRSEGGLTAFP